MIYMNKYDFPLIDDLNRFPDLGDAEACLTEKNCSVDESVRIPQSLEK